MNDQDIPTPRTDELFQQWDKRVITQHARTLERELTTANARIAELEQWIRGLERCSITNDTEERQWHGGEIGWLYPGQCAYVGTEKPEGLK